MNETVNAFTPTGGVLLFTGVLILVISGFIALWFHDSIFSETVMEKMVRALAIGGPIAISLTVVVCAFTMGRADFTATYEVEAEMLLPGTPSDAVGSPYLTSGVDPDWVSFTSRDMDDVLTTKTERISQSGDLFESDYPVWSIINDATPATARTEIESCAFLNGQGTRAIFARCNTRHSIHIPLVESVKGWPSS